MSSNYQNVTGGFGQSLNAVLEDVQMANLRLLGSQSSFPHNQSQPSQAPLLGFYQQDTDTFYVCENEEEFHAVMKLLDQNIQMTQQTQSYDDNFLFQDILQEIMELPDPQVELTFIE